MNDKQVYSALCVEFYRNKTRLISWNGNYFACIAYVKMSIKRLYETNNTTSN